jgi:hypothetical protein
LEGFDATGVVAIMQVGEDAGEFNRHEKGGGIYGFVAAGTTSNDSTRCSAP